MSLFGDESAGSPGPKPAASLFADDTPASRNTGSLFADDQAGADSGSSWGFASTKRTARGTLIKTLLPASDVPESYIDVFDYLARKDSGSGNTISPESVRKVLSESGVDAESEKQILGIVQPDQSKPLGRGETNVLLALIGLVQEGDDPTLDGVDERRRSKRVLTMKLD
jgi:sorting nexin-8